MDFLCPDLSESAAAAAMETLELLLTLGAGPSEARAKVAELFSPPRVSAEIARLPCLHLAPGETFDLREGRDGRVWDFRRAADREEALRRIRAEEPFVVIGSPPCTDFCRFNENLNFRNMSPWEVRRRKRTARVLLNFAVKVYELQLAAGRHFLHEHPVGATSWQEESVVALRSRPGIGEVVGHKCRYGLATPTHTGQAAPAMKPTRFLSSAPELLSRLGRRCTGDHKHQQLTGGRAREAATYPQGLCRAMLRGIEAQRRREGGGPPVHVTRELDRGCAVYALCKGGPADLSPTLGEVLPEPAEERVIDEAAALEAFAPPRRYRDAVTNEELPPGLTRAARKEELDFMKDWQVWETVPTAACWQATGRAPLQGKWVDVNKGDVANPVVRSRYVAKEFANQRDDEFFAATPPLEALRLLLSHAASGRQTGKGGRQVLVLDALKAHLHAMS